MSGRLRVSPDSALRRRTVRFAHVGRRNPCSIVTASCVPTVAGSPWTVVDGSGVAALRIRPHRAHRCRSHLLRPRRRSPGPTSSHVEPTASSPRSRDVAPRAPRKARTRRPLLERDHVGDARLGTQGLVDRSPDACSLPRDHRRRTRPRALGPHVEPTEEDSTFSRALED